MRCSLLCSKPRDPGEEEESANSSKSLLSGGLLFVLAGGLDVGGGLVVIVILGLGDLNEVGHDLVATVSHSDLGALHNLDLKTENTLTELDGTDSHVDEIVLGLTSGDLVTLGVLLGLCALTTDLTGDHDFATGGLTTAHDGAQDVVGGHTDGGASQKLEFQSLDVGGGAQVSVIGDRLDGKVDLVVGVVESVSLLNERLDLLDLTGLLGNKLGGLGGANTDLSVDGGSADLNTGVTLHAEGLLEELVELSLEDTISDELLFGVNFLDASVISHSSKVLSRFFF